MNRESLVDLQTYNLQSQERDCLVVWSAGWNAAAEGRVIVLEGQSCLARRDPGYGYNQWDKHGQRLPD